MEITSEKDKENSLPKQPIENQSNPSYNQTCHRCTKLNTLKEMDTQYHIRTNSLISTMENKIDLIDRTNKIEIQYLRDRVNKLEMENQIKASIHEKLPNETSRRRNLHANKKNIGNNNRYGEGVQYDNRSVNQLNQNHFNMPFQQSGTTA
jgi:hypothetical protein